MFGEILAHISDLKEKLDVVWKGLNEQLGDVQYPPATEEEVDQWEMKAKEALGKIPRFDRLRFKFPPHLREYLKLTGKAFKDYTDHSPRKELLQSFYGGFIADFDKLLEITAEEVIDVKNHAKTEKLGQRIYLVSIRSQIASDLIHSSFASTAEANLARSWSIVTRKTKKTSVPYTFSISLPP